MQHARRVLRASARVSGRPGRAAVGDGVATLLQVEDVAPRSRYLLMTPERYARLAPRGRIERLRDIETSAGPAVLCLNLDRACD